MSEPVPAVNQNPSPESIAKTAAAVVPAVAKELEQLAPEATGLKPGIQTTEFALMAVTSLCIVVLMALGKVDGTAGGILLSANAAIYQTLRQGLKSKVS